MRLNNEPWSEDTSYQRARVSPLRGNGVIQPGHRWEHCRWAQETGPLVLVMAGEGGSCPGRATGSSTKGRSRCMRRSHLKYTPRYKYLPGNMTWACQLKGRQSNKVFLKKTNHMWTEAHHASLFGEPCSGNRMCLTTSQLCKLISSDESLYISLVKLWLMHVPPVKWEEPRVSWLSLSFIILGDYKIRSVG